MSEPRSGCEIADRYNNAAVHEWNRLVQDAFHNLEFLLTMHFLRRHLPGGGAVLDAGGGPGRYALELCRMGYTVALLDLSDALLEKAREQFAAESAEIQAHLQEIRQGDIRDLSCYATETFAVTLCLGAPLSHLLDPKERRIAMRELIRVTRPGGICGISVVGLLAAHRTVAQKFEGSFFLNDEYMAQVARTQNSGSWHFFRAAELRSLAESYGLTTLEMAGLESLSSGMPEATNRLSENEAKWRRWYDLLLQYAADPAVVDMSDHMLYIGRKS